MSYVDSGMARHSIESVPGGMAVVIPAKRRWFVMIFLSVWLTGWTIGGASAIAELMRSGGQNAFLAVWLVGWLFGELFALATLAWQIRGSQRVAFTGDSVEVRMEALGLGFSRHYDPRKIQRLRVLESSMFGRMQDPYGFSGTIAFDYGYKTIRFGPGLEAAEARMIVEKIARIRPDYLES